VLGVVLALVIRAVVGRVIAIVLVAVLAGVIWSQRASLRQAAHKCDATFFGVHLTPSDPSVKQRCQNLSG
jgi:hypothetical protein